jgi:parallel beta-helix repeat protein
MEWAHGRSRAERTGAPEVGSGEIVDPEAPARRRALKSRVDIRRITATRLVLALTLTACSVDPSKLAIQLPPAPSATMESVPQVGGGLPAPRTLYVDAALPAGECHRYRPDARECQGGSAVAYRELDQAVVAAIPGDTVLLRGGTYSRPLVPARSGAPGAPITFRSYPGETAVLSSIDSPAIRLVNRSHVAIEGLTVRDVLGWGRLEGARSNVIRGNHFVEAAARGTTGGLKLVRSHFNRILENTFERGNDSLVMQESDRNLVAGNSFSEGRHSLVSVRCGNFNVLRENRFGNERQKAVEIYDCEGVSDAPFRLDSTKRNLFERNIFSLTRGPSQPHRYNAIQFAGQLGIVRRNVFHDNRGGAVNFAVYPDEALHNYGNRVYHNTFFANSCYAIFGSTGPGSIFGDNLVEWNIIYRNLDCQSRPVQLFIGNARAVLVRQNAILEPPQTPRFVSEPDRDTHLRPDSPMIDTAGFLTSATEGGSGLELPVADVRYFFDGFGIEGELGDLIQLAGDPRRARIARIDYSASRLILDTPLTWAKGQGVTTAYAGLAPDFGADEVGLVDGAPRAELTRE